MPQPVEARLHAQQTAPATVALGLAIIVVLSSIWVYSDVRKRRRAGVTHDAAWSWALAALLLLWVIVFPVYLWSRGRPGPQKRCPDCAERVQQQARVCRYCGHHFDGPVYDPVISPVERRTPPTQ